MDGSVLEAGMERTAIRVAPEIQKLTLIECLWGVSPMNESVPKPRKRFTCQRRGHMIDFSLHRSLQPGYSIFLFFFFLMVQT